ncbi:hypothetical protein [Undibacterium luofuense]|uniref:hypothetical protein n=1 Tax=Undibacterium luofuense TaxID=2828733 RepID=UPI0030EE8719
MVSLRSPAGFQSRYCTAKQKDRQCMMLAGFLSGKYQYPTVNRCGAGISGFVAAQSARVLRRRNDVKILPGFVERRRLEDTVDSVSELVFRVFPIKESVCPTRTSQS